MSEPIAVVLAAGQGTRMGGERPKTLIPLGGKPPLLHYILRGLSIAGIMRVKIVTGFRPEDIEAFVAAGPRRPEVTYAANPRWAEAGNYHSLRVGLESTAGNDVLVVNCDVVVHPDVYRRVAGAPADLVLALQARDDLDTEDMKVELRNGSIAAIGKALAPERSHGEYAGVSLVRPAAAAAYLEACERVEAEGDTSGYYEDLYARVLDRVTTAAAPVGPGEYAEVDEPADVAHAVEVIDSLDGVWN